MRFLCRCDIRHNGFVSCGANFNPCRIGSCETSAWACSCSVRQAFIAMPKQVAAIILLDMAITRRASISKYRMPLHSFLSVGDRTARGTSLLPMPLLMVLPCGLLSMPS